MFVIHEFRRSGWKWAKTMCATIIDHARKNRRGGCSERSWLIKLISSNDEAAGKNGPSASWARVQKVPTQPPPYNSSYKNKVLDVNKQSFVIGPHH